MKCKVCGTKNPKYAKFCYSCGTALMSASPDKAKKEEFKVAPNVGEAPQVNATHDFSDSPELGEVTDVNATHDFAEKPDLNNSGNLEPESDVNAAPTLGEVPAVEAASALEAASLDAAPEVNSTYDFSEKPEMSISADFGQVSDVNRTPDLGETPVLEATPDVGPAPQVNSTYDFSDREESIAPDDTIPQPAYERRGDEDEFMTETGEPAFETAAVFGEAPAEEPVIETEEPTMGTETPEPAENVAPWEPGFAKDSDEKFPTADAGTNVNKENGTEEEDSFDLDNFRKRIAKNEANEGGNAQPTPPSGSNRVPPKKGKATVVLPIVVAAIIVLLLLGCVFSIWKMLSPKKPSQQKESTKATVTPIPTPTPTPEPTSTPTPTPTPTPEPTRVDDNFTFEDFEGKDYMGNNNTNLVFHDGKIYSVMPQYKLYNVEYTSVAFGNEAMKKLNEEEQKNAKAWLAGREGTFFRAEYEGEAPLMGCATKTYCVIWDTKNDLEGSLVDYDLSQWQGEGWINLDENRFDPATVNIPELFEGKKMVDADGRAVVAYDRVFEVAFSNGTVYYLYPELGVYQAFKYTLYVDDEVDAALEQFGNPLPEEKMDAWNETHDGRKFMITFVQHDVMTYQLGDIDDRNQISMINLNDGIIRLALVDCDINQEIATKKNATDIGL